MFKIIILNRVLAKPFTSRLQITGFKMCRGLYGSGSFLWSGIMVPVSVCTTSSNVTMQLKAAEQCFPNIKNGRGREG